MSKMKIISIRLDEEELAEIDEALDFLRYYKRSDLIRAAVRVLLNANTGAGPEKDISGQRKILHKSLYRPFGYFTGLKVNLTIEHYDKRIKRNQE